MKGRARVIGWGFWVRRGVLALALGVVTTVGVAWGLAVRGASAPASKRWNSGAAAALSADVPIGITPMLELRGIGWARRWWVFNHAQSANHSQYHLNWGDQLVAYEHDPGLDFDGLGYRRFVESGRLNSAEILPSSCEDRRGWPRHALWCGGRMKPEPWTIVEGGLVLGPTGTRSGYEEFRALPLRVLWSGFLGDSAMFFALWFVVLFGPVLFIRVRCLVQRRCPMCAYDLAGGPDAGCPECGWGKPDHRSRESAERPGPSEVA